MKQFKAFKESNTHGFFEGEIAIALRELGEGPFICIADCTDDEGHWMDEIWSEVDAMFPKRIGDYQKEIINDVNLVYWFIDVPEIGRGLLLQDASPIGFIFKKEDIEKSNLNIEYI